MNKFERLLLLPSVADLELEQTWVLKAANEIGVDELEQLALRATRQKDRAYAPYSNYYVGAALLTESGNIYSGNNVEVVDYSGTTHAEQLAIVQAVAAGEIVHDNRKFIRAIAVTVNSEEGRGVPCGACRTKILEHCDNALVLTVNKRGMVKGLTSARAILPFAFTPAALGK